MVLPTVSVEAGLPAMGRKAALRLNCLTPARATIAFLFNSPANHQPMIHVLGVRLGHAVGQQGKQEKFHDEPPPRSLG